MRWPFGLIPTTSSATYFELGLTWSVLEPSWKHCARSVTMPPEHSRPDGAGLLLKAVSFWRCSGATGAAGAGQSGNLGTRRITATGAVPERLAVAKQAYCYDAGAADDSEIPYPRA